MASNSRETSPVPVKRAARTYGRVKETAEIDSLQPSVSHILSSHSNSHRNASPAPKKSGFSEPVPLTSAATTASDDDEPKGDHDASFGFRFAWKDKLKQLDQDSDEDEILMPPPSKWDASKSASAVSENTISSQNVVSSTQQSISPIETSQLDATASPTLSQNSPPVKIHRRQTKMTFVADSDSDSEVRHARQSPFSSPQKQTIRNSSPPTSDDELPAYVTAKSASKGKGKAKAPSSARDSPQLDPELLQGMKPRGSKKTSKPKIKAPSRKELAETEKDRFRIAVDQHVSIAKASNQAKFSLATLFDTIKADVQKGKPIVPASSDPIIAFSSSPSTTLRGSTLERRPSPARSPLNKAATRVSDSDSDLPDICDLIHGDKSKRDEEQKRKDLAGFKQRALALQKARKQDENSDDDLEIVDVRKPVAASLEMVGSKVMANKAAEQARRREVLYGVTGSSHRRSRAKEQRMTRNDLNAELTIRIQEINADVTRSKEEEWVRRGGKLTMGKGASDTFSTAHAALEAFADKGLMAVTKKEAEMEVDTEDDDEWTPEMRGSASPEPGMKVEDAEPDTSLADITLVDENDDGDHDENDENVPIPRRPRKTAVLLSDSEDENDENNGSRQRPFGGRILVEEDDLQDDMGLESARLSSTSSEERLVEEGDKENNTQLMYDRSEDKENKAVAVRHGYRRPAPSRHGSMYALEQGIRSQLSMSPSEQNIFEDEITQNSGASRSPLRTLADEDPFQPLATLNSSSILLPSPSLKHFDDSGADIWDDEPGAPLLGSLFKAGTQKESQQRRGGLFDKKSFSNALDLSQDVTALQPAFGSENLQRKADTIFEDEQRYLLEAANKSSRRKEELYVNEHGFLTQTRPAGEVEVYRSVPTPSQSFQSLTGLQPSVDLLSSPSRRLPLRTISMTSVVAEPDSLYQPLSRLRRLPNSPQGGYRSSSTPPPVPLPQPRSAFDVLQDATRKEEKTTRRKMINSEFLEEEAQESDEEEHMFGFKKQPEDEEEDGDHLDTSLATLVDDSKMDDDTMAADKVHEKFQEHLQQDDEELEKLHMAATKGEIRQKKRRKVGLLDSDEEDEEEDERNAEIRRRMNKRSRIERGDIKEYEGTAFFDVYATTTRDDEVEFAYLQSDPASNENEERKTMDDDDDAEVEEWDSAQFISQDELKRQVQEMGRQGDAETSTTDYNDVSWMEEDEPEVSVKTVSFAPPLPRNKASDDLDVFEVRRPAHTHTEQDQSRLQAWAKAETRTHHIGPGRSVAGAAVTGHGKRVKSGGGSLTNRALVASASSEHKARPLKAAPSMLAQINKKARAERF